jgi:peptide/nickel transport system permease protein
VTVATVAAALLRRLLSAVAVLFGAATAAFITLELIPGNPVLAVLGPNTSASPAVRAEIIEQYGFNRPLIVQYLDYLDRLVHGNLGQSYQLQQPVIALIKSQLGPTSELALSALLLAVILALVSAVATAGRSVLRAVGSLWELVAISTPSYWVGIVLLTLFSFRFHLFPVAGAQNLSALVLPAVTLALPVAGTLAQVLRENLEAVLGQPFVLTARARGLGRIPVLVRHALRHAAIPLVTLTGWVTGTLLGGAVLVESIFGRPGIGSLTLTSIENRDMPVVIGVVLLSALVFVVISATIDLLYTVIDPRLRTR